MTDYEFEVKKTGEKEYKVTPVPVGGCAAGCGPVLLIALGFIAFLVLGSLIVGDAGWAWEILSNPLVAVPICIFIGIPVLIIVIVLIVTIVLSKKNK